MSRRSWPPRILRVKVVVPGDADTSPSTRVDPTSPAQGRGSLDKVLPPERSVRWAAYRGCTWPRPRGLAASRDAIAALTSSSRKEQRVLEPPGRCVQRRCRRAVLKRREQHLEHHRAPVRRQFLWNWRRPQSTGTRLLTRAGYDAAPWGRWSAVGPGFPALPLPSRPAARGTRHAEASVGLGLIGPRCGERPSRPFRSCSGTRASR
jgi:hypothetical protein